MSRIGSKPVLTALLDERATPAPGNNAHGMTPLWSHEITAARLTGLAREGRLWRECQPARSDWFA